jgi:hypothetical protein
MHRSKTLSLFDHLVGTGEDISWTSLNVRFVPNCDID